MAFWRLGITGGFLAGAIWAPLWQLLVCVALIIGSDVQIELQMGPAFITGIIMGAFATLYKPNNAKIYFFGRYSTIRFIIIFMFVWGAFWKPAYR